MKARIFMCNVLLNRKNSNELGGRLRMTRKLLSVVLACICVVVAGCGDQYVEKTQTLTNKVEEKESNDLTEQETPASIKEDVQSKEDTSPVAEEEEKMDSYQFSTSIYQNGHLSIEYPLLT